MCVMIIKMAVIIMCLLYATHCNNCFTYILSLTPRNLVKCTSSVPFYKRKLRLTGCSIPVRSKYCLVSFGCPEGSCSVR